MSDAVSNLTVDDMNWNAGGVEEGTAEAEDAKLALISAVLTPILQLHGCQMRKRAHDAQQYKNSD